MVLAVGCAPTGASSPVAWSWRREGSVTWSPHGRNREGCEEERGGRGEAVEEEGDRLETERVEELEGEETVQEEEGAGNGPCFCALTNRDTTVATSIVSFCERRCCS